jgi:hypothetical protein
MILQDLPWYAVDQLKGRSMEVSAWATPAGKQVFASIATSPATTESIRLQPLLKSGEWQEMKAIVPLPESINSIQVVVGTIDKTPVKFDDVQVRLAK